jgi:hypothetical protein
LTEEGPWGSLASTSARHDGWTGALMARFCEVLAETGIVVDACLAVGKSANTAYANRRRDPLFAAMWEAALGVARNRLADALLARSIEGSVEYYYRDGELVGEKRHIDNRLGLAVLRRLDRLMETGSPLACRDLPLSARPTPSPGRTERSRSAPPSLALDWDQMIGALRTREPGAMATALAALKAHEAPETHETHDPPESISASISESISASPAAEDDYVPDDATNSVWQMHEDWWTDFPPPAGFDGVEHGIWGSHDYRRTCTAEEAGLMDAATAREQAGERAAQEADRNAYFAEVAAELAEGRAENDEAQS